MLTYSDTRDVDREKIVALYRANHWSSAEKPRELHQALASSHALVTAWDGPELVGLGNAISDGSLLPAHAGAPGLSGEGIGREIVRRLTERYAGFHQQILVADGGAIEFYKKCGFARAGRTEPMWVYQGNEH